MSPEQCQSSNVDAITDIWSVGIILYEMITGRLPFQGDYENAITYSIMNEEPEPLARYKSNVSDNLQRLVDKALRKDTETRYQTINDLLADLKQERKISSSFVQPVVLASRNVSVKTAVIFAGLILISTIIVLVFLNRAKERPIKSSLVSHKRITFTGNTFSPAISPDGQFIAYVAKKESNNSLMIQDISGNRPLEIFSGFSRYEYVRWSPDGAEVALFGNIKNKAGIYLVPRLGGEPRRIARLPFFAYSPNGSQIAGFMLPMKRIWFSNITTGDNTFISLSGNFRWLTDLDWSHADNRLLFMTNTDVRYNIWTIKTDGSEQQSIVEDSVKLFSPRWSANGEAIYYLRAKVQTKDLMKINVESSSGKAKSAATTLQTGLAIGTTIGISKDNSRLSYSRALAYSNLWLITLEGNGAKQNMKTEQLTKGSSLISGPSISPNGKKVTFSMTQGEKSNIYVMSVDGGQMQQLTFFNSHNSYPVWNPDGSEIAFISNHDGKSKIWKINTGGGSPQPYENTEASVHLTWSPGSQILYQIPGNRNFHLLNPDTEEEWKLVSNDSVGWMFNPRYSPDGRSVAVHWNRTGTEQAGLWLISLKDSSQTQLANGFIYPIKWSNDEQWIYAYDKNNLGSEILKISIRSGNVQPFLILPYENVSCQIAITPDEKRIVCTVWDSQSDIWMMENFDPEVK